MVLPTRLLVSVGFFFDFPGFSSSLLKIFILLGREVFLSLGCSSHIGLGISWCLVFGSLIVLFFAVRIFFSGGAAFWLLRGFRVGLFFSVTNSFSLFLSGLEYKAAQCNKLVGGSNWLLPFIRAPRIFGIKKYGNSSWSLQAKP